MDGRLNVGIIGFGMIGKVHAFGYRTLPFYARSLPIAPRITMAATARPETAAAAGNLLGCASTTDFREITENPEIDIVHVCSPNGQHSEALLSAIAHRKHLYCDKPLTATLDEARAVKSAFLATDASGTPLYGRTSQMTFHLRFFPAIIRAKQLVEEGRLGRIFQYRAAYLHASNAKSTAPFKWKFADGGGVIRDLGSHLIDLIDYLIGPPSEVLADSIIAFPKRPDAADPTRFRDVTVEDAVTVLTRGIDPRSGGAYRGMIEATKLATGHEDELRLEIYGEKGGIRFSLMNSHVLEFFDATETDRPYGGESGWRAIPSGGRYEPPHTEFPSPKSATGWTRAHAASLVHFLTAVAEEKPTSPDLLQGVRVQAALDVIERSAASGEWTTFDFV